MLDTLLQRVAIIGAAGKMGRGISLLLLQEMARVEAAKTGFVGRGSYRLVLVDSDENSLENLLAYLKPHLQKYAERNINALRTAFRTNEKLVDNSDIIQAFVEGSLKIAHTTLNLEKVKGSSLVFEAIVEDPAVKKELFQKLRQLQDNQQVYYFTNTSSIPIGQMERDSDLRHKIIGFHFYNPPAVQPLVELITNEASDDLKAIALEMGRRLHKILVPSSDVAGFIGNGYFLREISLACQQVATLTAQYGEDKAICIVDKVTRDFLIRPMGTFQLVDYVGLDVAQKIGAIMTRNIIGLQLHFEIIDQMVSAGILGGQRGDGSQKDGFFQYKGSAVVGIYNLKKRSYEPLPSIDDIVGKPPQGHVEWKNLVKDPHKQSHLYAYFHNLFADTTNGAVLAQETLKQSREYAQELVRSGVAQSGDDVNLVLQNGFAHLYGPINSYF